MSSINEININSIEKSIYQIKPQIILKGDVYGTDYDYKYNKNTNINSTSELFSVTDIAKINIDAIKNNFNQYLKFTNYNKEIQTKEIKKKYLLELFTNKFLLNKILNSRNNNFLLIDNVLESNLKIIQNNEKKIKENYELLRPINNDIIRLESKKNTLQKKKQHDDTKKKTNVENLRKTLMRDLNTYKQNKEKLLRTLSQSISDRENLKDDKSKRSELLKINGKIELTKQSIKEEDKNINSTEKKINSLEGKQDAEVKTSELDNINRLLNEYITKKTELIEKNKTLNEENEKLNKINKDKKREILQHNIRIIIKEIFPYGSIYFLGKNKLKIMNNPSDFKNNNIRITYPTLLPSINIQKIQNDYINKYIQDNINKLYREKLILSGVSKVPVSIKINKEMENTKEYQNLKFQLNKEAVEKFNREKDSIIKKEKDKIISNYSTTIKRDKIEKIRKLNMEKENESDPKLKQEIENKINELENISPEQDIEFKEDGDNLIPIINLKKGTKIDVTITLNVKIIYESNIGKKFTQKVRENIVSTCKNRRNKIKSMLNNAASRKIFKLEKSGKYISELKQSGGKKYKKNKKLRTRKYKTRKLK